jgi:zinc and cadmium transporter
VELASPFTLSLIIFGAGLLAGILPFFFRWSHRTAHRWIAFGAGSILGAAFLHMIPEGFEVSGASSLPMVLVGFLLLYVIEQFSLKHPHEEDHGEFYELGFLTFIGLTIHDLIDGIALGSGGAQTAVTPAIFLALVLHKVPTTFSLSLLLLHGDYTRKRIVLFLSILLLAIPIGTLLSQMIVGMTGAGVVAVGYLIHFSAGTFIYIGAYELLPEMHRKSAHDAWIGVFFALGIGVMFLLKLVHPVV